MTLALALILLGLMLMYAGIKGESFKELLMGRAGKPSTPPAPVQRGTGGP